MLPNLHNAGNMEAILSSTIINSDYEAITMTEKSLGQFLLDKGFIEPQMIMKAMKYQKQNSPALLDICREKGYIDDETVSAIRSDPSVEEVLIDEKYVTEDQLDGAKQLVARRRMSIVQAIANLPDVDAVQLQKYADEFKESSNVTFNVNLGPCTSNEVLIEFYKRFTLAFRGKKAGAADVNAVKSSKLKHFDLCFVQRVNGDKPFLWYSYVSIEKLNALIKELFKMGMDDYYEEAPDLGIKAVNTVTEQIGSALSARGITLKLDPPELFWKGRELREPAQVLLPQTGNFRFAFASIKISKSD